MTITIHPDPLPEERRNDPRRQAEMSVLDHLADSRLDGVARYEWKASGDSQEVDLALWVHDLGRFAIQVKGGLYAIRDYDWHLFSSSGSLEKTPPPPVETWDGAMSLHHVLEKVLGFYVFIIPVLVFPDMDCDPRMEKLAREKKVHLVWRGQDLSSRLEEIAATEGVHHPPTWAHIQNEFHAIMYGEPLRPPPALRAEPSAGELTAPARMDLDGATVVINNHGPLIMHFGVPDDLAAIVASVMPVPPVQSMDNRQPDTARHSQENTPPWEFSDDV